MNKAVANSQMGGTRGRAGSIGPMMVASLLGLIISGAIILGEPSGTGNWTINILLVTLIWAAVYFFSSYRFYGTAYVFSNAYILALALFHLSLIYMVALGEVQVAGWNSGARSVETAGWYVVLALSSFGVGFALAGFKKQKRRYSLEAQQYYWPRTKAFIFQQGVGLGLASLVFLAMAIASYGNILSYSRAEIFNLGADSRGFGVFMMVFPGAIAALAIGATKRTHKLIFYPLAALVVLLIMLSGYRSAALFPTLVGVIMWVKSGRKIPPYVAAGMVAVVLIAIAVIGVFRQMGAYEDLGAEELAESYQEASYADAFAEMGASVGVLAKVIELVPGVEPYRYGYSYWIALKEMFPNIGFRIDTDNSRSQIKTNATFDRSQLAKMKPADWVTYHISRWKFDNGQGVGFSAIGEPYLNFGMLGVVGYFVLLGYVLTRIDMKDIMCHPYLAVFMITIFWTLIRTVRNDFSNFTKPMGFILIVLFIWNVSLHFLGKREKFKKI